MDSAKKTCFLVCPIGATGSEIRVRANQVRRHIIEPILKESGYEVLRADDIDRPGVITGQIINQIMNADLVVADLTGLNPNVMYELGIRHLSRKPTIHIKDSEQSLPFDLLHQRTVSFNYRDLDSVAECKDRIAKQVAEVERDPTAYDNPVTVSIDTTILQASANPQERILAQVMSMLANIQQSVESSQHNSVVSVSWLGVPRTERDWQHLGHVGDRLRSADLRIPYNGGMPLEAVEYLNIITTAAEDGEVHTSNMRTVRDVLDSLSPYTFVAESSTAYREIFDRARTALNQRLIELYSQASVSDDFGNTETGLDGQ